jgi:hypothetical protein
MLQPDKSEQGLMTSPSYLTEICIGADHPDIMPETNEQR